MADEVKFWLWIAVHPLLREYPLILASLKLQLIRTKKRYAKLLGTPDGIIIFFAYDNIINA